MHKAEDKSTRILTSEGMKGGHEFGPNSAGMKQATVGKKLKG